MQRVQSVVARFKNPSDLDVENWPWWFGLAYDIEIPKAVVPNRTRSPRGGANINIIFELLGKTRDVPGDIAECGVFRGWTLVPTGLYVKQHGLKKQVLGFDSFQGFDASVGVDLELGGADNFEKRVHGFSSTSQGLVAGKLRKVGVDDTVTLVPGYFEKTLQRESSRTFSFVHLDCDLYESYKCCLEFFYPRLSPGAVVLFDEYNDPPWPGCNKAVDEFLVGKPEDLVEIESDNQLKWYFEKR
jgi:hypothetical protein